MVAAAVTTATTIASTVPGGDDGGRPKTNTSTAKPSAAMVPSAAPPSRAPSTIAPRTITHHEVTADSDVRGDTLDAVYAQSFARVQHQCLRFKDALGDHGLHHVQLQLTGFRGQRENLLAGRYISTHRHGIAPSAPDGEIFYRLQLARAIQYTIGGHTILDPINNPDQDVIRHP
jgi:hypothetical protein